MMTDLQPRYPSGQADNQSASQTASQTAGQEAGQPPRPTPASTFAPALATAPSNQGSQQLITADDIQTILGDTQPTQVWSSPAAAAQTGLLARSDTPACAHTPFTSLDPSPFLSCNGDSTGTVQANLGITNTLRILQNMPTSTPFVLQEGSMLQELEHFQTPDDTLVEPPSQDPIAILPDQDNNTDWPTPTEE